MRFLLTLLLFYHISQASCYVKYETCKEYVYQFKAKTSLHGSTNIILKGKAGFQFLPNKTNFEALVRFHEARMEQGIEQVDLLTAYNFGNWFSILMGPHGDIVSVRYPKHESYDVTAIKKTVAGYLSGKLKSFDEPENYEVEEEGPEGRHVAIYKRKVDAFDAVFFKTKVTAHHPASKHAEITSSKTTYISHEMQVPYRILIEENVHGFSKSKPGYKMPRLPIGPHTNLTVTMAGDERAIPGIRLESKGEMELIDRIDAPCDLDVPSALRKDSLQILLDKTNKDQFWKSDYAKEIEEVHNNLDSNLTCIRRNLRLAVPEKKDCFHNIMSILKEIPDEHLPDIVYAYLELNEQSFSRAARQDRLTMIDAIVSLHTELSQRLIVDYFRNPNRSISIDDRHRILMHFGSFDRPPIQTVVDFIEKLAFAPARTQKQKDLQGAAILAYGIMINLYAHMGTSAQKRRAEAMVERLERRVGIHDPYHWRARRSTDDGRFHGEMEQAGLVEALGNAGLNRSFHHIISHVNGTESPPALKQAGLHALRHYHSEAAAEALLSAALFEPESHIRDAALELYRNHPLSTDFDSLRRELLEGFKNGTYPRCPKPMNDDDVALLSHHHRVRRQSVWKGIQFHLKTPSVEWAKRFGNSKLGASMGLRIRNELDIDIQLTKGYVGVHIDDHAYAVSHVGLLGINLNLLDARVCLIGHVNYELNLLQEFGFDDVQQFVKYWDRFQNGVVKNIKEGVERFRQFMTGVKDFAKNIENLDETIDDIPRKVRNLRKVAIQAARKIGSIDRKALPNFAKPLMEVYWRIIKLEGDIKSDVMDFYNTLADVVKIEIPTSWRQVRQGVYVVGKSIRKLFKAPKEAISGIFKAIFKVKIGVEGLKDAKRKIEETCFKLRDEQPYWWDLRKQLEEINEELKVALKIFNKGYTSWIHSGVDKFENKMRREAARMIREIQQELVAPFKDIDRLAWPFMSGLQSFSNVLDEVKTAWEQLKTAYREARSIVDRLFGPKAYINFPKKLRSSGAGCDDGVYPTTTGGRYSDPGVDLEAEAGKQVKSPFSGFLSRLSDGRLVIEPDGSTFEDVSVFISNINPRSDIPAHPGQLKIYTGDILGTVKSTACINHLHVSMKEQGENIDPTRYLGQRQMVTPKWTQVCDMYKLVWLGKTRDQGYILRSKDEVDTSPDRSTSEPSDVDLPDPKKTDTRRRRKRDLSDVVDKVSANFGKFKATMTKFFDLPSDLSFNKFFREFSMRRIRLGTMVGLLNQLGMTESRESLITLVRSFIDRTAATKCVRPEAMTEEELRVALLQRGVRTEASREVMMELYYDRTSQCPMWGVSLPPRSACIFDKACLGVECCLDYRIGIFYKAVKAYASMDPCSQVLEMGVTFHPSKWVTSIQAREIPYGEEKEKMTDLKVDVFGDLYNIKIKYLFTNNEVSALLNLQVTLCETETNCLPYIDVIKDMLLPVPSCKPDGTVVWPKINLKDFFNRKHLIKELKKIKTNVAESVEERTLEYVEKELKLPSGFLRKNHNVYCTRPSRMTRDELLKILGNAASTANIEELRSQADKVSRRCQYISIPKLPSPLYCRISDDCFKMDCCMDIKLPLLNRTVALSALIYFDPCKFTLTYGFEHSKKTILLIDYAWGRERSWDIGGMKVKYVIDKTADSKFFILKFGISVCLSKDRCLIDTWVLDNHRIPVPVCNENFTKCFGLDTSLKELMNRGVIAATKEAMSTVLRCLDVEKYLLMNHSCPTKSLCSKELTPILERTCYPGLPCWRLQCNFLLNLFVMKKEVCAWVAFNPCSYEFEIGLGGWKYKTNLMRHRLGISHEIHAGSGLRMYYKYEEGRQKTSFKLKFGVSVCHKNECTPTRYILDGMEISKPFCDRNFTRNLPGGSIPNFLQWLGTNSTKTVARLAVDRALTYLGIRQCLTAQTCILPAGVNLDGWSRTCPHISNLPALSDNVRCAFSSNCRSVHCCLDVDIVIWRGSLSFSYRFDPCNLRFRVSFENCSAEEKRIVVGRPSSFVFHENVTFWYLVEKNIEGKGLLLSFRVHVCEQKCGWLNILQKTLFQIDCDPVAKTRKRRGLSEDVKELKSLRDEVQEKLPKLMKKFDDLVSEGKEEATQSYKEIQDRMQAAYKEIYGSDPQEKSLIIPVKTEDSVRSAAALIKPPSPSWNWEVIPPSGGAELFRIQRGESGDMKFVIGDGLTQAGIALLGDAIANMTIGDLESMLDFKDVDPVVAYNIMRQLRELYFHLVSELIDVVFGGKMNDALFKSFDYIMRGHIKFPRIHVNYYEYNYYFFVPPVPCLFSLGYGADGYWGVDFYMRFDVLSMLATGTVDPYIGLMAYGKGEANCVIFRGRLQLNGYIMETHLPSKAEIGFYKFPLDLGLNVDLVIIPLRFELVVQVEMKVLFFMRRRRRFSRRFRLRRVARKVGRAISRAVRFVTNLVRKIFKWKTLFRKILWEWSMPPRKIPGLINEPRKRPDLTPPSFDSNSIRRKRSAFAVDDGCRVFQVPNRPIEEPAIVLQSDPVDDVSKVFMTYSVGSSKGGTNFVRDMKFQGPSAIIEGRLAKTGPLYFTVTARNSQGLRARAFCILPVFDLSPPQGHVSTSYSTTSDNTRLQIEARLFAASPIQEVFLGIGYGVGRTGDALKPWQRVTPIRLHGPGDRRGIPYKLSLRFEDLKMKHNQLYFVNIYVRNSLNYTTIISSKPVLVDLTPPDCPGIINPVSERLVKDSCQRYMLRKWWPFCPSVNNPIAANHRVVVDGADSRVLWNGHKAAEAELRWTLNSHYISGRFVPFHDNETSIRGYSMCIGTAVGRCDVFQPFDPHEAIQASAEWTYVGYAVKEHNGAFPDGKYFLRLTAVNRVENGGPLATTVSHQKPFVIDTTPPEVHHVRGLRYNVAEGVFRFILSAGDPHSGLKSVSLGAGRTPHDLSVAKLRRIYTFPNEPDSVDEFDGELSCPLKIVEGERVFIHLLVYNNVGLEEEFTVTRPFVVDTTPPLAGTVESDPFFGRPTQFCLRWHGFSDPESGIGSFTVSLGSCPDCKDLLFAEDLKPDTQRLCLPKANGHLLRHNHRYYGAVIAFHGGSERLSVRVQANATLYDSTPPIPGQVVDGVLSKMEDQLFSSDRSFYRFQWRPSNDPESAIAGYQVSVFRRRQSKTDTETLESKKAISSIGRSHTLSGLHLHHKDHLQAELVSINGAKLQTSRRTTGITIDLTPPIVDVLHEGTNAREIWEFQSVTDTITIVHLSKDPESGIARWKFRLYTDIGGQRHLTGVERSVEKADNQDASVALSYNVSGLTLTPGHRYGLQMTVINGAGLTTVQYSPGVIVDITAPHIETLTIGSLTNKEAEIHDGFIWHQSQDTLTVTVQAFDPESQVKFIWIGVGTSETKLDVVPLAAHPFMADQLISLRGLNLSLADLKAVPRPKPAYFITVVAENYAGLRSIARSSPPILIVPDDAPGEVFASPNPTPRDQTVDNGRVVATFRAFSAPLHGIASYEVGVGSQPGFDDVLGFSEEGIVNLDEERTGGQVNLPVGLEIDEKHFITIRATTNTGRLLEAVSGGFVVNQSPPDIDIDMMTTGEATNGVFYTSATSMPLRVNAPDAAWLVHEKHSAPYLGEAVEIQRFSDNLMAQSGVPIYTNVRVEDKLGLTARNSSIVMVSDLTAPILDQVVCDRVIQMPQRSLQCKLKGLEDPESPIVDVVISLVNHKGMSKSPVVAIKSGKPLSEHIFFLTVGDLFELAPTFYCRVDVTNAAGLSVAVFSQDISRDLEPPIPGRVVDLGDYSVMSSHNATLVALATDQDQSCQVSRSRLTVAWEDFKSPQSSIMRYEVAVGSYPGAADLKNWTEVEASHNSITMDVPINKFGQAFSTVRAVTASGAEAFGHSNGIAISHLAAGSHGLVAGVHDGPDPRSRFQHDPMVLRTSWNFSGEPCPARAFEWAIVRSDGRFVRNFTDMKGGTSGVHFGLNASDGDTFFSLIRLSSVLGLSYVFRSPGVTIKLQPLIPGRVFDGPIQGHDLKLQSATNRLAANWEAFEIPHSTVDTSSNVDPDWLPKIEFYEVAFGTDPKQGKTDDVVPFTRVGLNTSVEVKRLDLQPVTAVYYATVRAYSRWFSRAQASSNGIRVGMETSIKEQPITLPTYVNASRRFQVSWLPFESEVGIKMYFFGVRKTDSRKERTCIDIALSDDDSALLDAYFDVVPRTEVGLNLKIDLTDLPLQHGINYTLEVIGINAGGKCARSSSSFLSDFTPPEKGTVALADREAYKKVFFVRERSRLEVEWTEFIDQESGVANYTISLLKATPHCASEVKKQALLSNYKPAVVTVQSQAPFTLEDLDLQTGVAYFIQIEAMNRAGDASRSISFPILVEDFKASPGVVKTSDDFSETDTYYFNDDENMTVSFLHTYASGHLELESVATTADQWRTVTTSGFSNIRNYPWMLFHTKDVVSFANNRITLDLERAIGQEGVKAGAISRQTFFRAGGSFAFRLQAAAGPFAVSSFVVSDGMSDAVAGFHPSQKTEVEVFCGCCLQKDIETCPCDCSRYFEKFSQTGPTSQPPDVKQDAGGWRITREDSMSGESSSVRTISQTKTNACGLQLTSAASNRHNITLWCFNSRTGQSIFKVMPLDFDASSAEHSYQLEYVRTVIDNWSIRLLVDNVELTRIDGELPAFPDTVTALFHVWNQWEALPPLGDIFHPYKVSMHVSDVRFPNPKTNLLRYGHPFRLSAAFPVRYDLRIALLDANTTFIHTFITDWRMIEAPCVPCDSECSKLYCDPTCPHESLQAPIVTIQDVNFTRWIGVNGGNITRFQVHVRLRSFAGYEIETTSTPATLDITPPEQTKEAPLIYYDAASKEPYQAVLYQASNTTLRVLYAFDDPESEIAEVNWAAGSQPGATDLFTYEVVHGSRGIAERSDLSLKNNVSYFVSMLVINKAGLGTEFTAEDGVRVLSVAPDANNIQATVPETENFEDGVHTHETKMTRSANQIGAAWTVPEQEYETKSEFCVGSRPEVVNDVVNCLKITHPRGGRTNITFRNGHFEVANITSVNVSDVLDNQDERTENSGIQLEPGKTLHFHIRACNPADVCSEKQMDKIQVLDDRSTVLTPNPGDISEMPIDLGTRSKRAVSSSNGLSVTLRTSSAENDISLIAGPVASDQQYKADTTIGYHPYIVDVDKTRSSVTRMLLGRLHSFLKPTFYVTTVGQAEMKGPLNIIAEVREEKIPRGISPQLVYWNTESRLWHLAYMTCSNGQKSFLRNKQFATKVCRTQSGAANFSTPPNMPHHFFRYETHFGVALVSDTFPNQPPVISTVPLLLINGTDKPRRAALQLFASDPEGDPIEWTIVAPLPRKGLTAIDPFSGLLTYRPIVGAIGNDVIRVRATDRPLRPEIGARWAIVEIPVLLQVQNTVPYVFLAVDGRPLAIHKGSLMNSASLSVVGVDDENNCRPATVIDVYALDMENGSAVHVWIDNSTDFHLSETTRVPSAFESPSSGIPNQMSIYAWSHAQLTYESLSRHQKHHFRLIAQDDDLLASTPLEVDVSVIKAPCDDRGVIGPVLTSVLIACGVFIVIFLVVAAVIYRWRREITMADDAGDVKVHVSILEKLRIRSLARSLEFTRLDSARVQPETFSSTNLLFASASTVREGNGEDMPMRSFDRTLEITSASNPAWDPTYVIEDDLHIEELEC